MSLRVGNSKPRRFRDAVSAQSACNPVALANSLIDAMREVRDAGGDHPAVCKDAAVRLIAYHLAYLLDTRQFDAVSDAYSEALAACEAQR